MFCLCGSIGLIYILTGSYRSALDDYFDSVVSVDRSFRNGEPFIVQPLLWDQSLQNLRIILVTAIRLAKSESKTSVQDSDYDILSVNLYVGMD